jgi:CRP/FNR family transcriptional regulator, cyclic AMP receptor protein
MLNPFYLNSASELSDLPVFGTLQKNELEELAPLVKVVQFPRNTFIYRPSDSNDALCFLLKGHLKKGIFLPDGKELVQYLIHPNEFFGFDRLTGHPVRPHYTKSLTGPVSVLMVPVLVVERMMARNEQFSLAILELVAKAVKRSELFLDILLTADVRTRITYFLKENTLTGNGQAAEMDTMLHEGLTQQEIAHMIGATRQTVALVMNELRKENKIDFNRRKIVIKSAS